jgi:hypothetical protein
LALFLSVEKYRYDILSNLLTISIGRALDSIYPIAKKAFRPFD